MTRPTLKRINGWTYETRDGNWRIHNGGPNEWYLTNIGYMARTGAYETGIDDRGYQIKRFCTSLKDARLALKRELDLERQKW
jgi:hypothetical protein